MVSMVHSNNITSLLMSLHRSLQYGNDFQVMSLCDEAVEYSPVAKFVDGHYVEGSAGVFLECTKEDETGFKVTYRHNNKYRLVSRVCLLCLLLLL